MAAAIHPVEAACLPAVGGHRRAHLLVAAATVLPQVLPVVAMVRPQAALRRATALPRVHLPAAVTALPGVLLRPAAVGALLPVAPVHRATVLQELPPVHRLRTFRPVLPLAVQFPAAACLPATYRPACRPAEPLDMDLLVVRLLVVRLLVVDMGLPRALLPVAGTARPVALLPAAMDLRGAPLPAAVMAAHRATVRPASLRAAVASYRPFMRRLACHPPRAVPPAAGRRRRRSPSVGTPS